MTVNGVLTATGNPGLMIANPHIPISTTNSPCSSMVTPWQNVYLYGNTMTERVSIWQHHYNICIYMTAPRTIRVSIWQHIDSPCNRYLWQLHDNSIISQHMYLYHNTMTTRVCLGNTTKKLSSSMTTPWQPVYLYGNTMKARITLWHHH